jgi:dGTPase
VSTFDFRLSAFPLLPFHFFLFTWQRMTPREQREQLEDQILSPHAARSALTRGRQRPEPPCPIRTAFQRDRDRIIHSKAFRRLSHKTHVFIAPEADHYRTRLTHTLEVAQIARTISRALRLNEDLTEAIALGHDLGHTPFGHTGEAALDAAYREFDPEAAFHHAEQSLRVVEVLEKDGQGLNLTHEVRDGIRRHTKGMRDLPLGSEDWPETLEGMVVSYGDRIAYVNHDIDDAIRAGLIGQDDLPPDCLAILGETHARRIATMVSDIVEHSQHPQEIRMGENTEAATNRLKDFLYLRVYRAVVDNGDAERVNHLLTELFRLYMANPALVPGGDEAAARGPRQLARRVCDHLAGMTDRFAAREFEAHFVPRRWRDAD